MGNRRLLGFCIAILCLQAVLTYGLRRVEFLPSPPLLSQFPVSIDSWQRQQDSVFEPAVLDMLAPDDAIHRSYADSDAHHLSLFVAYYKTQHRARNAHDPKVCLPGAGWAPQISDVIKIPATSSAAPLEVNYYVIRKGDTERVVLYWYQTHKRVIAAGHMLRAYRVFDTIWDQRTDMALVRVITPVYGDGLQAATARAVAFAGSAYPLLLPYFPPAP